jgi:pimeloyl-ACP methyl ester carboxylesterase
MSVVIMESPYATFPRAAMAQMNRAGAPGSWMQRIAIALAAWLTRTDYAAVSPETLIPQVPCPVLLIESADDPFLAPPDRAAIQAAIDAHPGPAKLWTVEGAEHLMGMSSDPEAYRREISSFLTTVGASQPIAAGAGIGPRVRG